MQNYFYETAIDSEMGKKLSDFWAKCLRCEREADRYAKQMGAKTYFDDPKYFAGGVTCIAFAEGARIDKGVWRKVGEEKDHTAYFAPDVEMRTGYQEIPHRGYELKDTFDRMYSHTTVIENGDKLLVPYMEFYREEAQTGTNRLPRRASNGLRKAIKAEMKRRKLPVVRTETLLSLLMCEIPDGSRLDGTPTFFSYHGQYFIGSDYECKAEGLEAIPPQIYRMNADKCKREAKRLA